MKHVLILPLILFSDTKLQSGLVARYQLDENDEDQSLRSPDFPCENPLSEQLNDRVHMEASLASSIDPDFSSLSKIWHSSKFDSDELRQKVDFLKIQAQVQTKEEPNFVVKCTTFVLELFSIYTATNPSPS